MSTVAKMFVECRPENATIVPNIRRSSEISDDFRRLQGTPDVWSQTLESRRVTINIWPWTPTVDIWPVAFDFFSPLVIVTVK